MGCNRRSPCHGAGAEWLPPAHCNHDVVEPGNSIRWPLGTTAWGVHKTAAIKQHVEAEYLWVEVEAIHHFVGAPTPSDASGGDQFLRSSTRRIW
ncbi:MAG: hypothetical protein EOS09_35065 [Mesorhizobium sp.]|nr:MAG: hypothetical protein EOS09_35065 [Mesorhizobium sp.]